MKIALVQLDANDELWTPASIPKILRHLTDVVLVMLPECMPFDTALPIPIAVASYGSGLNEPYWQKPLQIWSSGCGAPVLICGVSGKGRPFAENGTHGNYGGGGNDVFWPDGGTPWQRKRRGIYVVDITTGSVKARGIGIKRQGSQRG